MQNVMHIATNAGHTTQNDGQTMQNDGHTARNVGCNTPNVCQSPRLEEPPLWFLANIKCVAAKITYGADVIFNGPASILRGMTSICSNVHDILHFQHQFFEIFLSVLGKITLFSKSAQKMV